MQSNVSLLQDAVHMNESISNAVNRTVEDKIKVWLRQACDRDGGRKKRFLAAASWQCFKRSCMEDMLTDCDENDIEPHN